MAIAAKCSLMPISFFDIENNHALRRRLYVLGVGKVKDGGSCPTYLVTIARLREAFIARFSVAWRVSVESVIVT